MTNTNPFMFPIENYKRQCNTFDDYVNDTGFYLHKMTGMEEQQCTAWVKANISKGGKFPIRDPRILILDKKENGDREKKIITLGKYIHDAIKWGDLMAPTFTTFLQPKVKTSFLKTYTKDNIALRKKHKKAMFEFEMEGNDEMAVISDKRQNNRKTKNNSTSGAFTIFSQPLANPTAHAVLTSTCRVTSGYANANNEKLTAGNRHYWSPDIVINNITSIVRHTDYEEMAKVMQKYDLVYPSVEQTMACIRRGAMKYWHSESAYAEVQAYVEKLNALERAAFVYTGDLYHIRILNRDFILGFFHKLTKPGNPDDINDPVTWIKSTHPDYYVLAMNIHQEEMRGIKVDGIKDENNIHVRQVASTIRNIEAAIDEYGDFIKAFFTTTNVPASLAYFPSSIRHTALTSDTDSTIFTAQEWVLDLCDGQTVGQWPNSVAGAVLTFASQTIIHVLALMSANFGVCTEELLVISMKSEFKFHPFCPSMVAKHYMGTIDIREGNVFKVPDREVKGVNMRPSYVPAAINARARELMYQIQDDVRAGKKIKVTEILKEVADSERMVIESFKKGDPEFLNYGKIKDPAGYKLDPMKSPYGHHVFWNEVFGPKYGTQPEPPYLVMVISTEMDSLNKIKEWAEDMEDKQLGKRLIDYCIKHNKMRMTSIRVPEPIATATGIPIEILEGANYRKLVKSIHKTFYLVLEMLGMYFDDPKALRLVSDYY